MVVSQMVPPKIQTIKTKQSKIPLNYQGATRAKCCNAGMTRGTRGVDVDVNESAMSRNPEKKQSWPKDSADDENVRRRLLHSGLSEGIQKHVAIFSLFKLESDMYRFRRKNGVPCSAQPRIHTN